MKFKNYIFHTVPSMAPVKHPYFTSFTSLGTLPNLCALSVIQVAMSDCKKKSNFLPQTRKVVGCGHNLVVFVRAPRLACSSGSLQQVHFYVSAVVPWGSGNLVLLNQGEHWHFSLWINMVIVQLTLEHICQKVPLLPHPHLPSVIHKSHNVAGQLAQAHVFDVFLFCVRFLNHISTLWVKSIPQPLSKGLKSKRGFVLFFLFYFHF